MAKRIGYTAALFCAVALVLPTAAFGATPTFSKDIAPIMHENCAQCHRPNDIAPMSLMTYDEVRPWAKSIGKYVADGQMPPWHADAGFGPWRNDRSITDDERALIVEWVNAGAPKGNPKDMPPLPEIGDGEWRLGEPDYVITFDAVEVGAGGADQFHDLTHKTDLGEDKWITGVEVLPGARNVVHHVILWQGQAATTDGWIGAWAAGAEPQTFPEGTGRILKEGTTVIGDFHYHPAETAETDATRVGFHLAKSMEEVEKEMVNLWVMNAQFAIPAGDPNYEAKSRFTFAQDSKIWSLTPHLHYRGKDFSYKLTYPDGTEKELLKVSKYDFNWQTAYEYEEPLSVPAGTRIDCVAHWDNSADNPSNPDPTKMVTFGPESYDEMMIGFVDYTVDEGVRPQVSDASPVDAKLVELAEEFPDAVYKVMIQMGPGGEQASGVHVPKEGDGGWYVAMGSIVGRAPIKEIAWTGNTFTGTAYVPGQDPMEMAGEVHGDTLKITITTPQGSDTIEGTLQR